VDQAPYVDANAKDAQKTGDGEGAVAAQPVYEKLSCEHADDSPRESSNGYVIADTHLVPSGHDQRVGIQDLHPHSTDKDVGRRL